MKKQPNNPTNIIDFAAAAMRRADPPAATIAGADRVQNATHALRAKLRQIEAEFAVRVVAYAPRGDSIVDGGAFLDEVALYPGASKITES